jgi:hypothetical protein
MFCDFVAINEHPEHAMPPARHNHAASIWAEAARHKAHRRQAGRRELHTLSNSHAFS